MTTEPPWKYLANLDLADHKLLRRCMILAIFKLNGPVIIDPLILATTLVTDRERAIVYRMLRETEESIVLKQLLLRWALTFDKGPEAILDATEKLQRDATWAVRHPKRYVEEYNVARRAFQEGGWVHRGKVVHSKTMPVDDKCNVDQMDTGEEGEQEERTKVREGSEDRQRGGNKRKFDDSDADMDYGKEETGRKRVNFKKSSGEDEWKPDPRSDGNSWDSNSPPRQSKRLRVRK